MNSAKKDEIVEIEIYNQETGESIKQMRIKEELPFFKAKFSGYPSITIREIEKE